MFGQPEFQITARVDKEGNAAIKVQATCGYGNRVAAVSDDVTDEKLLSALSALAEKAIKAKRDELAQQVTSAAATALVVATTNGEKLY